MAQAESTRPASVLDASALLAHLNEEMGATVVRQAMADGGAISVINWTEVLSKLAERGEDPELAATEMRGADLIGGVVSIEAVTEADSLEIAWLRPVSRELGLSLADRACLALAQRLHVAALTADQAWKKLAAVEIEVRILRGPDRCLQV